MEDEFQDRRERLDEATRRLNTGEPIPPVEAALIENIWMLASRIPRERLETAAIGLGAICNPGAPQPEPEQQVALMARYMLLDALIQRGVLAPFMTDEALRKKVFSASAKMPCNRDDIGEALAYKMLVDSQAEQLEKTRAESLEAGLDPDHPQLDDKFLAWIDHGI